MRKKITLTLIIALLLFSQCKKQADDFKMPESAIQNNRPVISGVAINNWFATNPAAKYLTADWSKASQATINGVKNSTCTYVKLK